MTGWRWLSGIALGVFVLGPLVVPLGELLSPAGWIWTDADLQRLIQLSVNTLILVAGTLAVSLSAGSFLAVLLFRTSFPGRSIAIPLVAIALFVPIPVIVSSWQATLGAHGVLAWWRDAEGRPWASGMAAALWIHGIAAVPWVTFIVGNGLAAIEPELEEEAAQFLRPWRVILFVTLPRIRASVIGAAVFVALQTAAETNVTEMMQVSTLAEEMRTQFALSDAGLARTLALTAPVLMASWLVMFAVLAYLQGALPPLTPTFREQASFEIGRPWMRATMAVFLNVMLLAPLASLAWKLGLTGYPPHWQNDVAWTFLQTETRVLGGDLVASVITSLFTGVSVAAFALIACWLSRESMTFRWLLFGVVIWVWVLPAPAVGMALHETIMMLPDGPWKDVLWQGPSPAPLIWVQGIRAMPVAVVFLWPVVRSIPRELFEEARLGGAGAFSEFVHVVWPLSRRAFGITMIAAAALSLGEVGASARVETPGWQSFAKTLFDRMHTGVDNNVSALCLLMVAAITACGGIALFVRSFLAMAARR